MININGLQVLRTQELEDLDGSKGLRIEFYNGMVLEIWGTSSDGSPTELIFNSSTSADAVPVRRQQRLPRHRG
jgi:hypothetical protein